MFPYDPSAYDNLTIDEVDAQFASFINPNLKEQSVDFQQRQQVGRRNTVNDADDDMPALLPLEYPLCNESIDSNTDSDANIVPPEEDHIASRVGRQGNSLLSYAHHVASLVLPAQMTQLDDLAVNLAESIDPIAAGDPGSDSTPFLPEPSGLYKVLQQPIATRRPWIRSLVKELKGLVKDRGAFKKDQPGPNDTVVPVKKSSSASSISTAMSTSSRYALFSEEIYILLQPTSTVGTRMQRGHYYKCTSQCVPSP